ncbi:MAG TPA: oxidoreductase [Staphylococcus sp.]|nr:oxidoreductase [Staphylococcus sp.]
MKVALVTGASSGIGYETAKLLAKKDYCVYAASRNVENMQALRAYHVKVIQLDLTKPNLIESAVKHILNAEGRLDILVNNAGYGSYGAVEDVTIDEARKQFEVNLFGLSELTKAFIPSMRNQGSGKIINISSVGGRTPNYFGSWYHASKYALEGYSESLRLELSDFGIDVIVIEPGGIKTNWGPITAQHLTDSSKGSIYEVKAQQMAQSMAKQDQSGLLSHPSVVAKTIIKSIESKHAKPRYVVGMAAKPIILLHALLPIKLFNWILKKQITN